MSKTALNPVGEGYVLTSEHGDTITLSDADLMVLAQSAQRLKDYVLAKYSRGEAATAAVLTPVVQIAVNTDLHQTHLHLGMIDPAGARTDFSLSLDVAKELAEHLPSRVAELQRSAQERSQH